MFTYLTRKQTINRDKQEVINSLETLLFKDEINYIPVFPFCYFDPKYYSFVRKMRLSPFYGIKKNNIFEFSTYSRINSTLQIRFDVEVIPEYGKTTIQIKFKLSKFNLITLIAGVSIFMSLILRGNIDIVYLFILIVIISIQAFVDIYPILRKIKKRVTA